MRRVFFSFDWNDVWRVNQVRKSWVPKGNYKAAGFIDAAGIEKLKKNTDQAIKRWINEQLSNTSVTCVLIGRLTASSKWVNYEIQESIEKDNGLLGIYIHNVKDAKGNTSYKGDSPFKKPPMNFVDTPNKSLNYPCCSLYDWINDSGHSHLETWIEAAAKQAGR